MMYDGYIARLKLLSSFQVFLLKLLTQILTLKLLKEVPPRLLSFHHSNLDSYYIFLLWVPTRYIIVNFKFKNQRMELMETITLLNQLE